MLGNLLGLAGDLTLLIWLATVVFWAVAGAALASWLHRPLWVGAVLGAVLPLIGPLILLFQGLGGGRRSRRGRVRAADRRPVWERIALAVAAAVLAVAVWVVTGLEDTHLGVGGQVGLSLAVRDVGLGILTFLGAVAVLAAGVWLGWRPTRWPAVVVAWCASWWLLWSLGVLLAGGTLQTLVSAADLPGNYAVVQVGASWTWLGWLAVLLLAWSLTALWSVHRRAAAEVPMPAQLVASSVPAPPVPPAPPLTPRRSDDPFSTGW